MEIEIRGKNVKVSEERRQLIQKKLGKLDRYLDNIGEAIVELGSERIRKGAEGRLVVEMTVKTPANGSLLRGEERDNDLAVALDRLSEKMQRQITRYKERMVHHKGKPRVGWVAAQLQKLEEPAPANLENAEEALSLLRVKEFSAKPMDTEEALEQMELLGHNFFIFEDIETGQVSVVYRRNEGGFGLIRPRLG